MVRDCAQIFVRLLVRQIWNRRSALALLLVTATLLVYAQMWRFGFRPSTIRLKSAGVRMFNLVSTFRICIGAFPNSTNIRFWS
jgi:hypothetical protein